MHALGQRAIPVYLRSSHCVNSTFLQCTQHPPLATVKSLFLEYGVARNFPTQLPSDYMSVDNGFTFLFGMMMMMMIFWPTFSIFVFCD